MDHAANRSVAGLLGFALVIVFMASVYLQDIFYKFFENFLHASSVFDHTQQLSLLVSRRST